MKRFVYCNQKGGVGKSTFAVHHGFYGLEQGLRVLFIDLDGQGNSSSSIKNKAGSTYDTASLFGSDFKVPDDFSSLVLFRGSPTLNEIERKSNHIINHFRKNIQALSSDFDVCIIDTPPTLGLRMMSALIITDFVVCPFELSSYSIQGIHQMVVTIQEIKDRFNPDLHLLGLLANRANLRSNAHKEALLNVAKRFVHLMIKKTMGNRIAIQEALDQGIAVWDLKSSSAKTSASEMKAVIEHIEQLAKEYSVEHV